ncbi:MAG TPA: DNA polymerase III subunit epsilon [Burkholderiaceae bacterium]|nr:DNA polymerase III subunit epsilon [Burkholderiaceae bacterium]
MRQVVLDTETTGLEVRENHRIIEVGCIELVGRRVTDRTFHHWINPEREIDAGATAVHGLRLEDLANKPRFGEIVDDLLDFVRDAEVIIHNAPFDVAFLDAELGRLGRPRFESACRVTDTLRLAREMHPGKRNSLDALCERYGVSNRHRTLHGALLDAGLLAEVYLAMTRGQDSLAMDLQPASATDATLTVDVARLARVEADPDEARAHEAILDAIERESKRCVWRQAEA